MSVDCLLIVPFEPDLGGFIDPVSRQIGGAHLMGPFTSATHELESYVGCRLDWWHPKSRPQFGGEPIPFPARRSLTSVTLATHLERAGLSWEAIDPGAVDLSYWRRCLRRARRRNPRAVALSTTFVMSSEWLQSLASLIRQELPAARLIVGGYYYATNTKKFLELDADVLCVGEGETRLPQIVERVRDREALDGIPGLYIRQSDGSVQSTGRVAPLDMASLPEVDWRLAERIDPPVDVENDAIEFGVETQRGCLFKCEFCTYRTLASPSLLDPGRAAAAINSTGFTPKGYVYLTDATATSPHDRFEAVLEALIAGGGSPHPIWHYARVSDIDEKRARLMRRAGVQHVFVGQESGDQRMLNLMKKGTRVDQVKPAVASLGHNHIEAAFAFISGFPGETARSIENTRSLITSLNDGFESRPVVLTYLMFPFQSLDFAAVSRKEELRGVDHHFGYQGSEVSGPRAAEEVLRTVIATSRVPHAPAFMLFPRSVATTNGMAVFTSPHRFDIHRWWKTVERGIGIFLERELEGKSSNDSELPEIRRRIRERRPEVTRWSSVAARARAELRKRVMTRLTAEWAHEKDLGAGKLTRLFLGLAALRDAGSLRSAHRAMKAGTYVVDSPIRGASSVEAQAGQLMNEAVSGRKRAVSVAAG